jgi:tetratricopeptide (TPR) repeat protein
MGLVRIFAFAIALLLPASLASAAAAIPAVPVYDLAIRLLPDQHRLDVTGTIQFPAAADTTSAIRLKLSTRMHDFKAMQLRPGGEALPADVSSDPSTKGADTLYIVKLPTPAKAGAPVTLRISYGGGEKPAFVFSLEGPAYYADGSDTAWYPQQSGGGRGTGRLTFTMPQGYEVVASGRAEPDPAGLAKRFIVDGPLQFAFIAGRYKVTRLGGPIPVSAYTLKDRPVIRHYLEELQRVIVALSEEFGRFPYGSVAIAEVPQLQANNTGFDGASSPGLMFISDSSFDDRVSVAFYGHELSHQWWGNLLSPSGPKGGSILDEGVAQFGSLAVVERLEGAEAAKTFRVDGYPGNGPFQNARGYFRMAAAGLDHPLERLPDGTFVSHELADSKGFLVLDMLSRTVGRQRFRAALQNLARAHAFGPITWDDFLAALQRHSSIDLTWFYRQWFERTGAPDFTVEHDQKGSQLAVTIRQSEPAYRATVQLRLTGARRERRTIAAAVDGPVTRLTLRPGFRVIAVELDPDDHLLRWTPAFRAEADALAQVSQGYFLRSDGKFEQAKAVYENVLRSSPSADRYGSRFMARRGLAAIALGQQKWDEVKTQYLAALAEPNPPPRELPWAYQGLATAAKHLKDQALLERAVSQAVAADARLQQPTGAGRTAEALLRP